MQSLPKNTSSCWLRDRVTNNKRAFLSVFLCDCFFLVLMNPNRAVRGAQGGHRRTIGTEGRAKPFIDQDAARSTLSQGTEAVR